MKIVQSYWSFPLRASGDRGEAVGPLGGWLAARYHYFSWALSSLLFCRHYPRVELITDTPGKAVLIDRLGLPYSSVFTCLDELEGYPPGLWAIGKIHAYRKQTEPFLHADGDVFIWSRFPPALEQAPLVVQSFEAGFDHYTRIVADVQRVFGYLPPVLRRRFGQPLRSVNAGIIGGRDLTFFQRYTAEALEFIARNISFLPQVDTDLFNQVYEQLLFAALTEESSTDVYCHVPEVDEEYTQVLNFHLLPDIESYIHVVGKAKRNRLACRQVEWRLRYEFPEYYERVLEFLGEKDVDFAGVDAPAMAALGGNGDHSGFRRTLFLLGQKGAVNDRALSTSELEQVVAASAETETWPDRALRACFSLEKEKHRLQEEPCGSPRETVFSEAALRFRFMEGKSREQLLDQAFVLRPGVRQVAVDWYLPELPAPGLPLSGEAFDTLIGENQREEGVVLLYREDETNEVRELLLESWDALLMEFTEPVTGREVLEALLRHFGPSLGGEEVFTKKWGDFLAWQLVCEGLLAPAPMRKESDREIIVRESS